MCKIITNNRKAFSLIEVITVLFVVSLGLIGVLSLIVQNVKSQSVNKDNLIAYQLAQEGIELVRNVRDSNWKSGQAWDAHLDAGTYSLDYSNWIPSLISGEAPPLYLNSSGFYVHSSGGGSYQETNFSRSISIVHQSSHALNVTATVYWHNHNKTYSYQLETILYDWY